MVLQDAPIPAWARILELFDGPNDKAPDSTHRDFPAWEQSSSRVLYCFASYVGEQLLSYIRDAKTPKEAWGNLKKIFTASTTARKLQLRQEVSNLRQRNLSMADYTSKIKDICNSLASIDVNVEEGDMVQICVQGLTSKFGAFRTAHRRIRRRFSTYSRCSLYRRTTRVR